MNSDTKIISIIGIITVIIVVVGVMLAGGQQSNTSLPEVSVKQDALVREDSLRVTNTNAKIQLVEFADYECPACAMLHPSLKRILAEYKDQIDFTFRVIPIHQHSVLAASAVFAAREQGKFMEMNDIVFENQDAWTAYGKKDSEISAMFEEYAKTIGLDVAKYNADLIANASKYKAIIDRDAADAQSMGINSTPTGIINGKALIRGVVTYDKLKALIEAELNPKTVEATSSSTVQVQGANGTSTITTGVVINATSTR
ncbi:MAG: thioredoxin domain-containing protein [Candidatus Pacebacteria bacterium]|nr:thioredoxin domain-containing protein [Candidatus Paceibacterota bacterium]